MGQPVGWDFVLLFVFIDKVLLLLFSLFLTGHDLEVE
jgi:hypothetical protein